MGLDMSKVRGSLKASQFTESVIREMTRLARQHGAVNLSQGFPDFPAPEPIKEAARQAIEDDINQYAVTWGTPRLRTAIAEDGRAATAPPSIRTRRSRSAAAPPRP